jgi:hypothetical protein
VSLVGAGPRRRPGIIVHRRQNLTADEVTRRFAIPLTTPVATLVYLASFASLDRLEAAINTADRLDLVDPETLRLALNDMPRRQGLARLRRTLDRHTFTLSDSGLERLFLSMVRRPAFRRR